jgi:hypothetical protein
MSNKTGNDNSSKGLMWKLLKKHISPAQLVGFSLASLIGLTIVILAVQFHQDVRPIFNDEESFIKKDYLIITKAVSTAGTLLGGNNEFSPEAIADIEAQPWCRKVGKFSSNDYSLYATLGVGGVGGMGGRSMGTMLFFESIPTEFIDVSDSDWKFNPDRPEIPVIMSRDYLSLYNFGFAASQGLPQISEGIVSRVPLEFTLRGNGNYDTLKGRIVGFSNRLNTIVVPEDFMRWSNERYGSGIDRNPSRLIVEVNSPGDVKMQDYLNDHGYQVAGDKMQQGKAQYFLTLVVTIVIIVGIIISLLSFFVLMLSIYLLLQKNTKKLQDLLLLGYSPAQVSRTYISMVAAINAAVLVLAIIIMLLARAYYLPTLQALGTSGGTVIIAIVVAIIIMALITAGNIIAIKRKINALWIQGA